MPASLRQRLHLARARRRVGADRFARFGAGSLIVSPAIVTSAHRIEIGDRVLIHGGAWLSVVEEHNGERYTPSLRIGDGTVIGRDALLACVGSIEIGREVLMSDRVVVADSSHAHADPALSVLRQPMVAPRPVRIGDGAFVGAGAVILPGVTIGERAVVGANAVVTRDVPAGAVAVGNPARVVDDQA